MWSNIFNRKVKSTNIKLNTSASVECEIQKVKNGSLKKKGKYLRVDSTVEKLINYYDGKLRILGDGRLSSDDVENSRQTNDKNFNGVTEVDPVLKKRFTNFDDNFIDSTDFEKKLTRLYLLKIFCKIRESS